MTTDCPRRRQHPARIPSLLVLCLALAVLMSERDSQAAGNAEELVVTYLSQAADDRYRQQPSRARLDIMPVYSPLDGVLLGIDESRIPLRRFGITMRIEHVVVDADTTPAEALTDSLDMTHSSIVVLDLPKVLMLQTVRAVSDRKIAFFNVTHADDDMRGIACLPGLFHLIASHAMRSDALAQFLRTRDWTRVLMLEGPEDADHRQAEAFAAAADTFGLKIVAWRNFTPGNDPRERDSSNVSLLTASPTHDVVFVADARGEFARHVPYRTHTARPVVGAEGLMPSGWHWSWERHGAPQLNQRFERHYGRRMSEPEWAGWAAIKSLTAAFMLVESARSIDLSRALESPELVVDLYKGAPGNFRPGSRQLRQPMLLHTRNAVVERAPLDGFLHEFNTLDTLGVSVRAGDCPAR